MERRKANTMFDNKVLQAEVFYRREIISTAGRTPFLTPRSDHPKEPRPQGSARTGPNPIGIAERTVPDLLSSTDLQEEKRMPKHKPLLTNYVRIQLLN